jgi:two-component system cell cycle sensor histidine kinase PleC
MVDEVDKAGARIVALIDEMIQISQLDLNQVSVTEESFDLFTVLEQVASGVHEADDREVRLEVRGEAAGARMKGDLVRLRAGFAAFIRVIMREQPAAGTVVVDRRISRAAGHTSALIAIVDEQDVQRSYEVDRIGLEEKKHGGVGLSLPLARRVVERHGGRVWSPVLSPIEPNKAQRAIIVTLPLSEHRR